VPLRELAEIVYTRGPQMIRSEDTFLTAYVTFGGQPGIAEVEVVEQAQAHLARAMEAGELVVPQGVSWRLRATTSTSCARRRRCRSSCRWPAGDLPDSVFPVPSRGHDADRVQRHRRGLGRRIHPDLALRRALVRDFSLFGVNMRELFQMGTINLSVAVWVGFLALFGIAVDDGVVMATYLKQSFEKRRTETSPSCVPPRS
jgi:copper/silver efflux system protein